MHFRFIIYLLSLILVALGVGMLVSAGVTLLYDGDDLGALLFSAAVNLALGAGGYLLTRSGEHHNIGYREGFFSVGVGWLVAMVFGAIPFVVYGMFGPIDALFETMSGFTTTGASVLVDYDQPRGVMFWRSLTHWYGGMGIIVLFLAVLPPLGGGAVRLFAAEAPGPITERLTPRIRDTARTLWLIYVSLSALEVAALLVVGMPLYDAVVHTFGTMATGGFSPLGASIATYDSAAIEVIIIIFMTLAGANFALYHAALRGRSMRMYRDPELRLYLGILLVSTFAVAVSLMVAGPHDSWLRAFRDGAFQVVSIQTTTGFISADYEPWNSFAKTLLLLLMFVGGCAGSTAGGMKVVRLLVLAKNARYQIQRELHPQAVLPVKVSGRVIPEAVRNSILGFFFIYVSVYVAATLLLSASNVSILTAASAVAATLNNIGPGLELVGATKNFAPIADYGKVVLIVAMVLGRLELMAILVLFTKSFWRR